MSFWESGEGLTLGELEEEFLDLSGWTLEELKDEKLSKQKRRGKQNELRKGSGQWRIGYFLGVFSCF